MTITGRGRHSVGWASAPGVRRGQRRSEEVSRPHPAGSLGQTARQTAKSGGRTITLNGGQCSWMGNRCRCCIRGVRCCIVHTWRASQLTHSQLRQRDTGICPHYINVMGSTATGLSRLVLRRKTANMCQPGQNVPINVSMYLKMYYPHTIDGDFDGEVSNNSKLTIQKLGLR